MSRFPVILRMSSAVGVVVGASLSPVTSSAQAASDRAMRISSYDIDYRLGADGAVDVTEDIAVRFDDTSHHGLDRFIITAQGYNDSTHRVYPLTNVSVTSSTGAPTDLSKSANGGATRLRIGDPDRTVTGTQRYTLKYRLAGVVNKQSNGSTEFYINAVGSQWSIPIDKATVTLKGPAAVNRAQCFYGESRSTQTCAAQAGPTATYSARSVGLGEGMSVLSAMPTSAFTSTAPILEDGSAAEAFGSGGPFSQSTRKNLNLAGGVGALAIPAAVGAWLLRRRRRTGDRRFGGVTPGEMPAQGQSVDEVRGPEPQVAVRFEPPRATTPGLMGTIIDKSADNRDVAGTIVDLAVRGYLTMKDLGDKDWLLTAKSAPTGDVLLPYEAVLLNALFADGTEVRLSDLRNEFAGHLAEAKEGLYRETLERGWFDESPQASRSRAMALVVGFFVAAAVAFFVGNALNLSGFIFAAGFAVAGLLAFFSSRSAGARTPVGSAIYDQARGFELYLKTAEAKQFKFEEAEQIFSRYMPYAVVLGLAERWAKVFGEVAAAAAAQGYPMVMPYWYLPYGGFGGFGGGFDDLGSSLDAFGEAASAALASTPGSSGNSGFSSGGGFSGGGISGGGGGGW